MAINNSDLFLINVGGASYSITAETLGKELVIDQALGDHSDVVINNVQDEDFLRYNQATGQWENVPASSLGGDFLLKTGDTFTGDNGPLIFSDGTVRLTIPVDGSQIVSTVPITVPGPPGNGNHAVNKNYVDGRKLGDINDVDLTQGDTLEVGSFLTYDGTDTWEVKNLSLADLGISDGTSDGDILVWDPAGDGAWTPTAFPIAPEYDALQAQPQPVGGIVVGSGFNYDPATGKLDNAITGALAFKGTCDLSLPLSDATNNHIPATNTLVAGDTYVHAYSNKIGSQIDAAWSPSIDLSYVIEGGEMATWTGSGWVVSGRITTQNFDQFVRKSGDTMSGTLEMLPGADIEMYATGTALPVTTFTDTIVNIHRDAVVVTEQPADKSTTTQIQHYNRGGSEFGLTIQDRAFTVRESCIPIASYTLKKNQSGKCIVNKEFLEDLLGLDPTDPDYDKGFVKIPGDQMTGALTFNNGNGITLNLDPAANNNAGGAVLPTTSISTAIGYRSSIAGPVDISGTEMAVTADLVTFGPNDIYIKDNQFIVGPATPVCGSGKFTVNRLAEFGCNVSLESGDLELNGGDLILDGGGISVNGDTIVDSDGTINIQLDDILDVDGVADNDGTKPDQGKSLIVVDYNPDGSPIYGFAELASVEKLDDLSDVVIYDNMSGMTPPANGHVLWYGQHNNGQGTGVEVNTWANIPAPIAGKAATNYNPTSLGMVRIAKTYQDISTGDTIDTNIGITQTGILYSKMPAALKFKGQVDATKQTPAEWELATQFNIEDGDILIQYAIDPAAPVIVNKGGNPNNGWKGLEIQGDANIGVTVSGGEMIAAKMGSDGTFSFAIIGDVTQEDFEGFVRKAGDHMYGDLLFTETEDINGHVTIQMEPVAGKITLFGTKDGVHDAVLIVGGDTTTHNLDVTVDTSVGNDLVVGNDLDVGGDSTLVGKLDVTGDSTLGQLTATGDNIYLIGKDIQLGIDCDDANSVLVKSKTTFNCDVTFVTSITVPDLNVTNQLTTNNLKVEGTTEILDGNVTIGSDCAHGQLDIHSASFFNCPVTTEAGAPVLMKDTLTVGSNAITPATDLKGTLAVGGAANFAESVTVADGKATILGGTAQVKLAATFNHNVTLSEADKTLTVNGEAVFGTDKDNTAIFNSDVSFKDNAGYSSTTTTKVLTPNTAGGKTTYTIDGTALTEFDLINLGMLTGTRISDLADVKGLDATNTTDGTDDSLKVISRSTLAYDATAGTTKFVIGEMPIASSTLASPFHGDDVTTHGFADIRKAAGAVRVAPEAIINGAVKNSNIRIDERGTIYSEVEGALTFKGEISAHDLLDEPTNTTDANGNKIYLLGSQHANGTCQVGDFYVYNGLNGADLGDGTNTDPTADYDNTPENSGTGDGTTSVIPLKNSSGGTDTINGWENLPIRVSKGEMVARGPAGWSVIGTVAQTNLDGYVRKEGDTMHGDLEMINGADIITSSTSEITSGGTLLVKGITTHETTVKVQNGTTTGDPLTLDHDQIKLNAASSAFRVALPGGGDTVAEMSAARLRLRDSSASTTFEVLPATGNTTIAGTLDVALGSTLIGAVSIGDDANPGVNLATYNIDEVTTGNWTDAAGNNLLDEDGNVITGIVDINVLNKALDADAVGNTLVHKAYISEALEALDGFVKIAGDTMEGGLTIDVIDPAEYPNALVISAGNITEPAIKVYTPGSTVTELTLIEFSADLGLSDNVFANVKPAGGSGTGLDITITYTSASNGGPSSTLAINNGGIDYLAGETVTATVNGTPLTFSIIAVGGISGLAIDTNTMDVAFGGITGTGITIGNSGDADVITTLYGITSMPRKASFGIELPNATDITAEFNGAAVYGAFSDEDATSLADNRLLSKKQIQQLVDLSVAPDITNKLNKYEFIEPNLSFVGGAGEGVGIKHNLQESVNGVNTGVTSTEYKLLAGKSVNIIRTSDSEITIEAETARTTISPIAPVTTEFAEGDLWFNSSDGRIYILYPNPDGNDYWVDASPAALNADDFLKKAGDEVLGNFMVDKVFSLKQATDASGNPDYANSGSFDMSSLPDLDLITP